MMKNNNDAKEKNGASTDSGVETKDKIINMYRSVKNSAYSFITKSLIK